MERKHFVIIGVLIALTVLWYFFLRKKNTTSSFIVKDKKRDRTKVCNCTYLGKPNKICSWSVNCNACCEGAGTGGQEFVSDLNDLSVLGNAKVYNLDSDGNCKSGDYQVRLNGELYCTSTKPKADKK
jgi:hypothetical protein